MVRGDTQYWNLIALCDTKQFHLVHLYGPVLASSVLAAPIHQQERICELLNLRATFRSPRQGALLSLAEPRVILGGPCTIGHATDDIEKTVSFSSIMRRRGVVLACVSPLDTMHFSQDDDVLKLFSQQLSSTSQLFYSGRARGRLSFLWLV